MKLSVIAWGSEVLQIAGAAEDLGIELDAWPVHSLREDAHLVAACRKAIADADCILVHPSYDPFWDELLADLREDLPLIAFGYSDTFWSASTVPPSVVATVSTYFLHGGEENIANLLRYLLAEVMHRGVAYDPPRPMLWEGLYHPDAPEIFADVEAYLAWHGRRRPHCIGLLFSRTHWVAGDCAVVDSLIRKLEEFADVIPVFCYGVADAELGTRSARDLIRTVFAGRIDALVEARSFIHSSDVDAYVGALSDLGVPVFHPLILYHSTAEEWEAGTEGMSGTELCWCVAIPEFQGLIEMIPAGAAESSERSGTECEVHVPLEERIGRIAARIRKWITLRKKPPAERKVVFVLHNKPCSSVEATVGAGAHLDTLESVARILRAMRDAGYAVECPESGEDLIAAIMEKKAISEFRWTSVEEIVRCGGALALVSREEYEAWFETLPGDVRRSVTGAWGAPPGEEMDGVPPAMIYRDAIVVTGVRYGNAVVCVQPKRGCAGPRCDGQVCRILHDPGIPPTHQYLATYHWLEETFGADVVIHVGTHGNLEFLPGKSVALSGSCFPDIAVGTVPHLYIYNSDNPPEGTMAKRRSYATIVDHMQTVMTESDLYAELKDLEEQIAAYERAKPSDAARAHALEHTIVDLLRETNLADDVRLDERLARGEPFGTICEAAHRVVTGIYNTQIPDGMHVFGDLPDGSRRTECIAAILRYTGEARRLVLEMIESGADPAEADSLLLREVDGAAKDLIAAFLDGLSPAAAAERALGDRLRTLPEAALSSLQATVLEISGRIDASDEIESLLRGCAGGYIEAGPAGLITRGRPDVLPTGRNFYSLDPFRVPTKAAWRIGSRLAEGVVNKYREEHGSMPENIAIYWMASDIMWADGEGLAQILALIGVEPVWVNGRVTTYRIIPLEDLGRPRVDVTVRTSGILRDNFYNCIELLDDAIREVALLDEPPELNALKRHEHGGAPQPRIFGSRPGTYGNGVNLAVHASAWKEEADLADIFVTWNGFAYGRGSYGEAAHESFADHLRSVDVTFNKTVTDEYDLLGCCCYFGSHGGMTAAARTLGNREVPVYYGDTRESDRVEVRTLAEEVRRVVRTKLLNPAWIEGMRRHGYKGAGDISRRVGSVYGWEATTQEVDDWIFDGIAKTFVLDDSMRQFFEEQNPWALEEIGRRLLEANERGLWEADPAVLDGLRAAYLEMEGWIEERMGDAGGDVQGGAIRVVDVAEAKVWRKKPGADRSAGGDLPSGSGGAP